MVLIRVSRAIFWPAGRDHRPTAAPHAVALCGRSYRPLCSGAQLAADDIPRSPLPLWRSQVSYTIVSLIFVFNFVGFMLAALVNVWITHKLGFGTVRRCAIIVH